MSGLFGSKKSSNTTTVPYSGKYADQVDYVYQKVKNNLDTPATAYPGQLSAGLSGTQSSALSGYSGLINNQVLSDTIAGKYLSPDSNPYLSQYYDQAKNKVMESLGEMNDNVNSQFNVRGLYYGSARQEALQKQANKAAETLANMATNIYGNAYNQERERQLQGINQQSNLLGNYFNMGTTEQNISQDALDRAYKEWLRQQGVDENDLSTALQYLSLVKNPSQTTTERESKGIGSLLFGK
ncbi:hypothetical protein TcarDRAFT_1291 [Thermosinus carboxydivorans Nor1]|uniref:Uncharacterized protein n=1 Tax=Thermosinus carboxydivorans Nor1 TaxID=401526 RepID=A1HR59_9FIRM|nr:hypothetical protein [Thermosinus carboxydivorans]EAX47556.1 hypothetical protein TcarDRAFT_1291 [Thermosinus carboxydivorans Nor1]